MIEQLIAEATECDFKVALETKKPKSWLKSVSAFSNGIGGTLFFGISDDRKPIGLSDVQKDAEAISRLIKERITPLPQFILKPLLWTTAASSLTSPRWRTGAARFSSPTHTPPGSVLRTSDTMAFSGPLSQRELLSRASPTRISSPLLTS